jgi:hypothetical protein
LLIVGVTLDDLSCISLFMQESGLPVVRMEALPPGTVRFASSVLPTVVRVWSTEEFLTSVSTKAPCNFILLRDVPLLRHAPVSGSLQPTAPVSDASQPPVSAARAPQPLSSAPRKPFRAGFGRPPASSEARKPARVGSGRPPAPSAVRPSTFFPPRVPRWPPHTLPQHWNLVVKKRKDGTERADYIVTRALPGGYILIMRSKPDLERVLEEHGERLGNVTVADFYKN